MTSLTLRFIFDHPLKQWPTGRKRAKDRNTKNSFFLTYHPKLKKDETGTYKGKSIKQTVTYFTGVQENLAV